MGFITKGRVLRFFVSVLGMILLALSINLLSWQFRLISGGMPGYALMVNYLSGISVGTVLLVVNTIVLAVSFLVVGRLVGAKAVFGYIFLSVCIDLTRSLLNLAQVELDSFMVNALLLVVQGLLAPVGISMVLASGYSFGSYSTLIPIIEKYRKVNAPLLFWSFDTILAVIVLLVFGIEKGAYLFINAIVFYFSFKYFYKLFKGIKLFRQA